MGKPYQQTPGYIPRKDETFLFFLENFSNLISADPGKFGLDASDAQVIADQYASYSTILPRVMSGATRTPGLVAQKDAIKASSIATVRVYAMQIKANKAVDNQDKVELGIHVNDPTPTPIPVPDSAPLLSIIAAFSGEHVITFADENSPHLRKKPAGVKQIQIYRHVAQGAMTLPEGGEEVGLFTKQPVKVAQHPSQVGLTATYFGRWVNGKGEKGPWSLPVCMTIAFGGAVDQQMPTGGTFQADGEEGLKIAA